MGLKQINARMSVVRYTDGSYDIELSGLQTTESVRTILKMVEKYVSYKKRKGEFDSISKPLSPIGSHPVTAQKGKS